MINKWVWWLYGAVWGIASLAVLVFLPRGEDWVIGVLKLVGILGVIIAVVFMLIALVIPEKWYQKSNDRR